jgi:hypothetical protein
VRVECHEQEWPRNGNGGKEVEISSSVTYLYNFCVASSLSEEKK